MPFKKPAQECAFTVGYFGLGGRVDPSELLVRSQVCVALQVHLLPAIRMEQDQLLELPRRTNTYFLESSDEEIEDDDLDDEELDALENSIKDKH